ncbi:MAG: hypothetical protein K1Y02_05180 [Candidatus Hydrogenedentes bacterium]|nr:hypothetical protein [Candidatus Hydrogenedentota bacterium]
MAEQFRVPESGSIPLPTPEHQQRITRQKWFEIATVILLIAGGLTFLGWRDYRNHHRPDPAATLGESVKTVEAAGYRPAGTAEILGRQFVSFVQPLEDFECHVDLVGLGAEHPVDTAVIWLTPLSGSVDPSEQSLQKAVNTVGFAAQALVAASTQALETASKTMEFISDAKRPHDKGVAGTNNGWKLTYVTYREFNAGGPPEPMLCLILERLASASDAELSELNRGLHKAVNEGADIKTALLAEGGR